MTALIVDDEPIARQVLREQLESVPELAIVGEAASGAEALVRIGETAPDLLFLDLHMPDLDGLGVARTLRRDRLPLVVFVTAYDKHALAAFDSGAVDYLLKPVRFDRLLAAVEKARTQLAGLQPATAPRPAAAPAPALVAATVAPRRIVGRIGSDQFLLDPAEVIAFTAEGESVYIITAQHKYAATQSLRGLEEKLPAPPFRRIHRGAIINADHIRKISPLSSKRWLLRMSNGMEVIVSKRLAGVIRHETRW